MGALQPTWRVRLLRRTDGRFDEPDTSQKYGPEARLILGSRESAQSLAGCGFLQNSMRLFCRLFKLTRERETGGRGRWSPTLAAMKLRQGWGTHAFVAELRVGHPALCEAVNGLTRGSIIDP